MFADHPVCTEIKRALYIQATWKTCAREITKQENSFKLLGFFLSPWFPTLILTMIQKKDLWRYFCLITPLSKKKAKNPKQNQTPNQKNQATKKLRKPTHAHILRRAFLRAWGKPWEMLIYRISVLFMLWLLTEIFIAITARGAPCYSQCPLSHCISLSAESDETELFHEQLSKHWHILITTFTMFLWKSNSELNCTRINQTQLKSLEAPLIWKNVIKIRT